MRIIAFIIDHPVVGRVLNSSLTPFCVEIYNSLRWLDGKSRQRLTIRYCSRKGISYPYQKDMKKTKILLLISLFICLWSFTFSEDFLSLFRRGLLAFNQKDYSTAIDYFSRALESPTRSSNKRVLTIAFNCRGKAFYELREYDKALVDFAKVKELNPKFAEVFNNCGRVYYDLREHEKAIENYTEAIRLDRRYIDALYNRGLVFLAKSEYKNAVEDFNEVIRLKPEYTKAYSIRGLAYSRIGMNEKAAEDFKKALDLNPKSWDAYFNRGLIYVDNGEYEKAIEDFSEALKLKPWDAELLYRRGINYSHIGSHEKAILDLKKAVDSGHNGARQFLKEY